VLVSFIAHPYNKALEPNLPPRAPIDLVNIWQSAWVLRLTAVAGKSAQRQTVRREGMRVRLVLIAALLAVLGCPPPAYFEIYNNTSEPLTILTRSGDLSVSPYSSIKERLRELVYWRPAGEGLNEPVLAIQQGSFIREYTAVQSRAEEFLDLYGSIHTWKLQIEPSGILLVVRPNDSFPVPEDYAQPDSFPVSPIIRNAIVPNVSLKFEAHKKVGLLRTPPGRSAV
jgi:hypothetical protein